MFDHFIDFIGALKNFSLIILGLGISWVIFGIILFFWCKKNDRIDEFFIEGYPFGINNWNAELYYDFFVKNWWGVPLFCLIFIGIPSIFINL